MTAYQGIDQGSCWLPDEAATVAAGGGLAAALSSRGLLIFLCGDLGAGKTTLVRGLLRALDHPGAVKSPTYTLVEPYELPAGQVYHFDLYRLGDPGELEFMGIRDYLDGHALCLVEWPERGEGVLPRPDLVITLRLEGVGRRLEAVAISPEGAEVLESWLDQEESPGDAQDRR
ncbi:MAG: tRNA (adenosine(37)-N6)-threonylcarbamoyltransferase complex ATPase subunit type 1 TsaE [Haliea sp.]|nr:tRNA (adenosine(37)-N6)-threonylcarbamoyltransferase complex ATPase subunit type 1 TsaE [Haliea sp.]